MPRPDPLRRNKLRPHAPGRCHHQGTPLSQKGDVCAGRQRSVMTRATALVLPSKRTR